LAKHWRELGGVVDAAATRGFHCVNQRGEAIRPAHGVHAPPTLVTLAVQRGHRYLNLEYTIQ